MRLPRLQLLLALVLIPALVRAQPAPAPAPAAAAAAADDDSVTKLVLRDAPLDLVLAQLENWTGKIVLRPQALPAAIITLTISHKVSKAEAVLALESVLELNGIGIIYMGDDFIKVVDLAASGARETPTMIATGQASHMAPSNEIASEIFELHYLQPSTIAPQLNLFLNARLGGALTFANSTYFEVTDTIANLQRVEQVVARLDNPTTATIFPKYYPLVNAQASTLATTINSLLQGPLQNLIGAGNVTLAVDARTNTLIVIGAEGQFKLFDELVKKLDTVAAPLTKNTVIPLNNATASTVVQELHNIISAQQQNTTAGTTGTTGVRAGGTPGARAGGATGGGTATLPTRSTTAPQAAVVATNPAGGINPSNGAGGSTTDFSSYLSFTNDDRTNSIAVTGTPTDVDILTKMIQQLDQTLAQVRIECVIVDVTLTDEFDSGISALGLQLNGGKLTGISGTLAGGSLSGSGAQAASSTTLGLLGSPLTMANTVDRVGLTGLISLTTTPGRGKAFVLSAPEIATAHNTQAQIFVGETVPIATGSVTVGGTGGVTTTIGQINIGVTLAVLPLIGPDGTVQMSIATNISDSSASVTIDGNPQPIISTRTTTSTIVCKSGEIIVLGGQRRNSDKLSTSLFGGIPVIGELLGSSSHQQETDDLIFFVRPVVLTNNAKRDNFATMRNVNNLTKPNQIRDLINHPQDTIADLLADTEPVPEQSQASAPNATGIIPSLPPQPSSPASASTPAAQSNQNSLQRPPR